MIDSMPNPIFYKDREGVYLGCNEAFSDMLALKKEVILGKTVYDLAPLELAVVYEKADNELFESGTGQRYESQVRYADGTFHDVVFNKAAFYDGDGDVAGLFGVMFDITDRKKTEEALRRANDELEQRVEERTAELVQSEQKSLAKSDFLDSVINSISHGLVVIDVNDYTVKLANKAVVSGVTDKSYCYELMHDKTMPCGDIEGHCPLLTVKKTGKPAVAQHDHVNPDGSVSYVEIHAYPVFDENGELIQVIENIMDITDRKKAEQAVIEAKEMAETTSRLMSEFLDMVSHELRTPMTSVHGFAKLIDKTVRKHFKSVIKDDEALGKHVDRIKGNLGIIMSESERLTELISDHLDLSKLESGRGRLAG